MKTLFRLLWYLLATATPFFLHAQGGDDPAAAEVLENFFRDLENASESDAQQLQELLDYRRANPLNLNAATREQLLSLQIFDVIKVDNLVQYREQLGPLINELELQAVPGWNVDDIRTLLLYAQVSGDLDTRVTPIHQGFYTGKDQFIFRWGRPMPENYPPNAEGFNNAVAFRWRHLFDNRLSMGFTAENDPGEAFFTGSNRQGFDFYSAHLFLQNAHPVFQYVALGDFTVRMGQGLLMQSGFAPGKSAETVNIVRSGRSINPFASFGEAFYFRGGAVTARLTESLELTALASFRRRDGNLGSVVDTVGLEEAEVFFTAFQNSGLHRTPSEVADEKEVKENIYAGTLKWLNRQGHIALNGQHLRYDRPLMPSDELYRKYVFRGDQLTGFSVDYQWRFRNVFVFGETARSDNGGVSTVNGLLFSPERRVTMSLLQRAYGIDYQSIYALPFAETTGAANEQGLFLGADIRPVKRWQVNVYADVWRYPWLRFGVSAPSQGSEYLARVLWKPNKIFSTYALWQLEIKESDSTVPEIPGLVENRRGRLRLHANYKVLAGVELRSRVEWMTYQVEEFDPTNGFLLYQEAVIKPLGSRVYGTVRYALFDTDDFDTRVFAYENDLFASISIPGFSGQGSRYYFNIHWRVNRALRLEARWEETIQNRVVTDSGETGRQRAIKLQARFELD
ncbi:MAG: hypothetical protein SFV52_08875 [Saprospiraceae bacterium]|nr:hypothetical protein [Saprospiraceae bacterium]